MRAVVIGAALAFASYTMAAPEMHMEKVLGKTFIPAAAPLQRMPHISAHPETAVAPADLDPVANLPVSDTETPIAHLRGKIFKLEEMNDRMKAELESVRSRMGNMERTQTEATQIDAQAWTDLIFGFKCICYGTGITLLLSTIYKLFVKGNGRAPAISMTPFDGVDLQPSAATALPLIPSNSGLRTAGAFMSESEASGEAMQDPEATEAGAQSVASAASDAATSPMTTDCLVVGAGISGATLAHNLKQAGVDMLLTEARDYVGGNVVSHNDDGFIWEEGPNSFATQPSVVRIAYELGISDQLVFADESLPPWVNHNGMLHPLPKGKGSPGPKGQLELVFGSNGVLKFGLAGQLLSWPGKIRAAIGAFLGHPPPPDDKEETIREWITRVLGEEVFLRCIDPFVSGVYAGDPETLSMKAALGKIARIEQYSYSLEWNKFGAIFYGGLKRQVELEKERKADPPDPRWPKFSYGNPGSFRNGLSTLPNAISESLGQPVGQPANPDARVRLNWQLTRLERAADGTFVATYDTPAGKQTVHAKTVVSTAPTHALRDALEPVMPDAMPLFDKVRSEIRRKGIYYPPVAAVTVAYPKSAFKDVELANGFGSLQDLPGFGSLNPRTEGVRTLGTLWSSSLFPGRCPPDWNILLNYIGGSRDRGIAELTEEDIIAEVDKGCRQVLLKPDAPEPKILGMKLWPTAIPQYELGHAGLIEALEAAEAKVPGLWVCGNYRTGVAFPDCVTFGYNHAKVVQSFLDDAAAQASQPDAELVAA